MLWCSTDFGSHYRRVTVGLPTVTSTQREGDQRQAADEGGKSHCQQQEAERDLRNLQPLCQSAARLKSAPERSERHETQVYVVIQACYRRAGSRSAVRGVVESARNPEGVDRSVDETYLDNIEDR